MASVPSIRSEPTERSHHKIAAKVVLAGLAGLLLAASYALHPMWWATWLVPVPLLAAASGGSRWRWVTATVASSAAMAVLLSYYLEMNGPVGTALILVLRIAALALALRMTEAASRRLPLALAMLALPATFAAVEQIVMTVSAHGATGSIAYSQMDMPAFVQVAALGGVPAVVFLILLPGSFVGLWLVRDWPRAQRVTASSVMAGLMVAVALFSTARMGKASRTVATTLIATNQFEGIPQEWQPVWRVYGPAIREGAARGGLVVLPEKIALLNERAAMKAAKDVSAASRASGATIVVGLEVQGGQFRNRALVAFPNGATSWYDKQRLVPGFEARDVPGSTPLLASAADIPLGIAICKDMHIPSIGREYGGEVHAMAVPAWDFGSDGWMGARMTAMRAVENGYAIARASRDGLLGVYEASGRVVKEMPTGEGPTILHAQMPVGSGETLYGRVGDCFGWTCVLSVMLSLIWSAFRKWRPLQGDQQ